MAAKRMRRWLPPGVETAMHYRRAWLWPDVRAGLVVTALLIPAGMGYAEVAGLPPETGLYATIVPLLAYAVFGPSRILVLGPDSSLAPIIAAAILPLALGDDARAVALAGLLAIMVGAILLLGGILRLGFVTDLLSKPIRVGYLNAIALIVIISQMPEAARILDRCRLAVRRGRRHRRRHRRGRGPAARRWRSAWARSSSSSCSRWVRSPVPGVLVAVVARHGAHRDPRPRRRAARRRCAAAGPPRARARRARVGGCRGARAARGRHRARRVHRQRRALAHLRRAPRRDGERQPGDGGHRRREHRAAASSAGSRSRRRRRAPRSPSRRVPARSSRASSAPSLIIGVHPPRAGTHRVPARRRPSPPSSSRRRPASSTCAASCGSCGWTGSTRSSRSRPSSACSCSACSQGIVVTIGLSLLAFVNQAWRPYRAELGRVTGLRGYHDLSRYPEGERIPGIVIVRFDAPLFFANGGIFDDFVRSRVKAAGPGIRTVILAAEPITDIDTTAIDELVELDDYLDVARHPPRARRDEGPRRRRAARLRAAASASRPTGSRRRWAPPSTTSPGDCAATSTARSGRTTVTGSADATGSAARGPGSPGDVGPDVGPATAPSSLR